MKSIIMSWLAVLVFTAQASSAMVGDESVAFEMNHRFALAEQVPQDFSCADVHQIPLAECQALVTLYNSTNGPNWTNQAGWLTSNTPCYDWFGVACILGRVQLVDLGSNGLTGSIPTSINNLSELFVLDLSRNHLVGAIPASLGEVAGLKYLHLEWNQLSGEIPPQLGGLSRLQDLYLTSNALTGSIPLTFGALSNLEILQLELNQLRGSIPRDLGNLGRLRALWLDNNHLVGSIPAELGNLSNLRVLALAANHLVGSVPAEIGSLANLQYLWLNVNPLSGALPGTLLGLTQLNTFGFDTTNLCEPGDAEFQTWLGTIPHLSRTDMTCGTGSVEGLIWNDQNWNGQLDPGEPGIPDLQVTLSSSTTVQMQPSGARVTYTDDTGAFTFDNVVGGSYQLTVEDPLGSWPTVTQSVTAANGSTTVVPPIGFSPPLVKTYVPFAVSNR